MHQKMYSLIKIGGFALGIAACLLISLYITDELSYDKQFHDGASIFRVIREDKNMDFNSVYFPAPFANALKLDFPEVELAGRINRSELFGAGSDEIRPANQEMNSHEEGFAFADQSILDIFNVKMVYGDRNHALDEPNTIVISKRKAEKYFPNENPVGKTLIVNNEISNPYRITGVMDFPSKSHFQYDFLFTLKGVEFWEDEQNEWNANNYHTYVKLRPGVNASG